MSRPCHIVLTTIHYPDTILTALYDNIRKFNHLDEVKVWVVGDLDTPAGTTGLAKRMPEKGLETAYLDDPAQEGWGNRFEFCKRLAYRNDARRNLGYLKALEEGCETLVSIDDDNFPSDDDLVGLHMAATGKPWTRELIREERNFHNICEYLEFLPNRPVFPRGYPFRLRATVNTHEKVSAPDGAVIGVMIGLWLGAPDVDATTWLQGEIEGVGYGGPDILVLHPDTWSPLNTQNTSVARRLIPGFLNVPMGWDVAGIRIQRYGDIWGAIFCSR